MRLEDYLELPYPISLVEEAPVEGRDPIWFAEVQDLPGCTSQGDSPEDAIASVRRAMALWIEDALEAGQPVPQPRTEDEYSGRFLIRAPRGLHARLVHEAQREGISLNQFVTNALSGAVGWRAAASTMVMLPLEDKVYELTPLQKVTRTFGHGSSIDPESGIVGFEIRKKV